MTGRHVRVALNAQPDTKADINLAKMSIRERLMRWLFGPVKDVTVLVPGRHVEDITITNSTNKDLTEAQLDALAATIAKHPAGKRHGVKRDDVA